MSDQISRRTASPRCVGNHFESSFLAPELDEDLRVRPPLALACARSGCWLDQRARVGGRLVRGAALPGAAALLVGCPCLVDQPLRRARRKHVIPLFEATRSGTSGLARLLRG